MFHFSTGVIHCERQAKASKATRLFTEHPCLHPQTWPRFKPTATQRIGKNTFFLFFMTSNTTFAVISLPSSLGSAFLHTADIEESFTWYH